MYVVFGCTPKENCFVNSIKRAGADQSAILIKSLGLAAINPQACARNRAREFTAT